MTDKNFAPAHYTDHDDDSAKSPDIIAYALRSSGMNRRTVCNVKVTCYAENDYVVCVKTDCATHGKTEVDSAEKAIEAALYLETNVQKILDSI